MKKILATVLAIFLIITICPLGTFTLTASAAASGYFTYSDYTYTVIDDKATIIDVNSSISGDITIPSTLGGYPVTSIGDEAFADCTKITSLTIPDSVTSIGDRAFYNCWNLTSLTIPDSVTSIGLGAFILSSPSITVDEKNNYYSSEDGILFNKTKTEILFYPPAKTANSYIIPDSVTSVGYAAFFYCFNLESLTIPNSVTNIGNAVFADCYALTSITIPDSVTSIGEFAFRNCESLTSVTIGEGVTSIGNSAFESCTTLKSITIPDSVTSIGDSAFADCTSLKSINIPKSVTSIGEGAFNGCSSLQNVYYEGSICDKTKIFIDTQNDNLLNATWNYEESAEHIFDSDCDTTCNKCGFVRTAPHTYDDSCDTTCNKCGFVRTAPHTYDDSCDTTCNKCGFVRTAPHTYDNSCDATCNDCDFIRKILHTYTNDSDNTCNVCGYVRVYFYTVSNGEATITDVNSSISDDITIPSTLDGYPVTSIGNNAFEYCYYITSITIPDSVTSIGDSAFSYCDSLTSVTIGEGVTSIGNSAFEFCHSLKSATIGNGVTSIGEFAFWNCESLTSITIPNSVTSIGDNAFNHCTSLTSITIPDSVTSIGNGAFVDTSLTSITIPDSIISIGGGVFSGCPLTTVNFNATNCVKMGSEYCSTFYASNVKIVYIGEKVIQIPETAFAACTSLKSINIPKSVTSIGEFAFWNCESLESVRFGNNITSIGNKAFYGCSSLQNVYYEGSICDKTKIFIDIENDSLLNATWNYEESAEHVYDNDCDTECNVCKYIRTVSNHRYNLNNNHTCDICKYSKKPNSPTILSVTNNSVTLVAIEGFEYSIDGVSWQNSNVFNCLSPNVEYTFYQRVAENEMAYASESSNGTKVTTFKDTLVAPVAPIIESFNNVSVTLKATEGYEYKMDDGEWQLSNVFTGLNPNTEYTFYQRIAETEINYATESSLGTSVSTLKHTYAAPAAPIVESFDDVSVTLKATEGYEYKMGDGEWQLSNVFTGLNPNTEYTFYQRIAETDINYVTESSLGTSVPTLKHTYAAPVAPTVENFDDVSVTLKATDGYEYSIDGLAWQTSNIFANLDPNKEYTFYQRIAETDINYVTEASEGTKVTTLKHTYTAPVAPIVENLNDIFVKLKAVEGCEYSIDGINWQSSNIFTGLAPNTQYTFYQRIAETDINYVTEASEGTVATTLKHTYAAPIAPTVESFDDVSVTLKATDGYEYSLNGSNWQLSNVFTDLNPNTEYTFYQRIAETKINYVTASSLGTKVTTLKHTYATPAAPIIESFDDVSVTLKATEGYEYKMGDGEWQASNVFTDLNPNAQYTFYQRIAESNINYVTEASAGTVATTLKHTYAAPVAPTVESFNDVSVTLKATDGYEYSIDGLTWQTSNIFANLDPNKAYTFYQRIAETEISYATVASEGTKVTTLKHTYAAPVAPTVESFDDVSVTLKATDGYEYSLNVTTWQSSNVFTGLNPNTQYTFYQRIAETEINYVTDSSLGTSITTLKHTYNAPAAPIVESFDDVSITLKATEGYEYKMGDGEWQLSNVFTGLNPNTEYTFYQRIAETDINYVTESSVGKLATTDRSVEIRVPKAPTIESKTNVSFVVVKTEGYEYSLDGITWQDSNEFTGLDNSVNYRVYQRIKQTDTHYPSQTSTATEVELFADGDVDGNDEVNDADAMYLLMFTFFPDDYKTNQDCDFNGDGEVNDADAMHLLMFTFFPEDYPLH